MSEKNVMNDAKVVVEDVKEESKKLDFGQVKGFVKDHEVEFSVAGLAVSVGLAFYLKKKAANKIVEAVESGVKESGEQAKEVVDAVEETVE